jgi:pyridoxine/pyridoxamine 5'-phosphate oxidase
MEPIADNPPGRFLQWPAVASRRPDLAECASIVLRSPGATYLATVSKVGRPRVTQLSVTLSGERLLVTVAAAAPAARDLRANPFFHLHATSASGAEQLTVRGWARIVLEAENAIFELLADAADGSSPSVAGEWAAQESLPDRQEGSTPCPS